MKAYVEIIQRRERELGTDMLTHQKVCTSEPMSFMKKGGVVDLMITRRGAARTMSIT